ncbi:type II toxin-antitoxin system VapC family toxin [Nodularia spumigena]|jgi:predicted nucleic acid-binding protein|uniref:Twitching motility protein PilT n=2 Tax=Nodularia spumigena TaxID=70799 RepID=A0A161URV4_NODSP|nr:PIN domain-containing protein [Nodularia spumigena]KZL48543.1 twitching motility protein PilT [Nodularia spumigena CENA596]MEA5523456.1 PIN domain-containing protein [Nodularia spumigena UHCC 0143]MEA5557838.1 PIN domain-containing protein [Nodularia spumigena CH309]MEA5607365.1 PIN domain-containing protein [Nodularia spumigena UHCC 0060]MEA5611163.1 PIN domain-containing protein [Nodularia spumigena UHCC 0040]
MSVIVDTSVWSLALRRRTPPDSSPVVTRLRDLITNDQVALLGAIRQEILSGIRSSEQFTDLRDYLRAFPDVELIPEDYEIAAEFFNTCRSQGIQGSNTDFLICAVAYRRSYSILTTDNDFHSFRMHIPIILLPVDG